MKSLIKTLAFLLIGFGVIDFVLAEFMDTWITGQFYPVGSFQEGNLKLIYWTPYVSGLVGGILYYINIHFLKPKNLELVEGSVKMAVTRYEGMSKEDGKLYITPEKITFDAIDTIDIQYNEIQSVSRARVMLIFPAIKIVTMNDKFLFANLLGMKKALDAINNFKNKQ